MDTEDAITKLAFIALVIVTVFFILEYSKIEVDTCGNKICDLKENYSNCEVDCGSSLEEQIVFLDSTDPHFVSEKGSGYENLPYKWLVNGYPRGKGLDLVTHIGMLDESKQYYLDWGFEGSGWWKMTVSASNDGEDWTYIYYTCSWTTGTDCQWDFQGEKQVLIPSFFYEDLYLRFNPSDGNGEGELIYLDKLVRISTERDYSRLERKCPLEIETGDGVFRFEWTDEKGCVQKKVDLCGNRICDKNENCLVCPGDCRCGYGFECVDGECVKETFSIDLPDVKGMTWNVSYTPNSEKIKISSSRCFYLDIFNSEGGEIDPYDSDVKTCRSSVGDIYSTIGRDSASWFNWGGCASTKYYEVGGCGELILRVHTDNCSSCVCYHPDFNIYEKVDSEWVKYSP
jgi:hypothetical protein